jgi:hypothetical protein
MIPRSLPTLQTTLLLLLHVATPSTFSAPIPRSLSPRAPTCTVAVALTLDMTLATPDTIYMLSWVQDSTSRPLAYSSSDPSLPYGTVAWRASSSSSAAAAQKATTVYPSISYQGNLNESMKVTYVESGRGSGRDYVQFLYDGRSFRSDDAGKGCDGATSLAAWRGYVEPALAHYRTRHISCTFEC